MSTNIEEFNELSSKLQELRLKTPKRPKTKVAELSDKLRSLTDYFKSSLDNLTSNLNKISGDLTNLETSRPPGGDFIDLEAGSTSDLRIISENLVGICEKAKKFENNEVRYELGKEIVQFKGKEDLKLLELLETKSRGCEFTRDVESTLATLKQIRHNHEANEVDSICDCDSFIPKMSSSCLVEK